LQRILISGVFVMIISLVCNSVYAQITQTITVSNKSGMAVTSVFISPAGSNNWGSNISAKAKITNNETFEFKQIVDKANCNYDVKYTGDDGKEYIVNNVDLCSGINITLQNSADIQKTGKKLDDTKKEK
jgi:hypothetical protein